MAWFVSPDQVDPAVISGRVLLGASLVFAAILGRQSAIDYVAGGEIPFDRSLGTLAEHCYFSYFPQDLCIYHQSLAPGPSPVDGVTQLHHRN